MDLPRSLPTVAVLLSTYNGERFIARQLDSILHQNYAGFSIYVRDDGSTDDTVAIVRGYTRRYPRISLECGSNLGCVKSFLHLLAKVDADVYMFCDQDDVWLPGKVGSAVSALEVAGLDRPLLYHTDLVVVDEQLKPLAGSFMAQQRLHLPKAHALEVLAIQNCVVGCTIAMTAPLVRAAKITGEIACSAAMHDWWLAMLACCTGGLIYSPKAEILYRQHGKNVSGAIRTSLLTRIKLQLSTAGLARINAYRRKVSRQAQAFSDNYRSQLDAKQQAILQRVIDIDPKRGVVPVIRSQLAGIKFQNTYMNIALLYTALATRIFGASSPKSL